MYRTYNVSHLISAGPNAVGLWIASGWSQYTDMKHFTKTPLVLAELHIIPRSSPTPIKIVTDQNWKCSLSTTTHIGSWGDNGSFGGDSIDERRSIDDWNSANLIGGDSSWEDARVYEISQQIFISADVMEPTVRSGTVEAAEVTVSNGAFLVEMAEVYTGWFEVSNMHGAPGSMVKFSVSTTEDVAEEYGMVDTFFFGSTGVGTFRLRFAYHEIQYITITGLAQAPSRSDIVGHRIRVNLTKTGDFSCSSSLISKMYDTTVNNYLSLTTGGMTVDCPHRERRGYGGDAHTSYEFALDNFGVGAYFTKWARDWRDVQQPDGYVPHTAPTVSGGGGPAWSGYVVTLPYQMYLAHGDRSLLSDMYPTMKRLLTFFSSNTKSDGLLHPWDDSSWTFLGDWITPHGSENKPTSRECILFNNCYLHYIISLTAEIAKVLGMENDSSVYRIMATEYAKAINIAFSSVESGIYLDMLQTHLVMPLASGVVPPSLFPLTMQNLEHSIVTLQKGHLDTGLTGTYFMTKFLTEVNRNDLVFIFANQTTFPGYGYFLSQGYTTWPEDWHANKGTSKIHGCYNAIGLWFLKGVAGITIRAEDPLSPIQVRAGVESGDISWASASRAVSQGIVSSSWSLFKTGFSHNISIPVNSAARVLIPAEGQQDVQESGKALQNVLGIKIHGMSTINQVNFVELLLSSGNYRFTSSWNRGNQ